MSRATWLLVSASLAVVVVALVVAAVTGGSVEVNASERSTAKQLDACAVFTQSDAQSILGPATPSGGHPGGDGGCAYLSGAPVSSPAPTLVSINIYDGQPPPVSDSYDGGPPQRESSVSGVGNRARWYFYGRRAAGVLDVHKGNQVVRVMVGDAPVSNKATAIASARVILSRLP
jgi:hypothetical protein